MDDSIILFISICSIIYFIASVTYTVFGYIYLINDYKIAHECDNSNLWEYVLVIVILSTIGCLKLIFNGCENFSNLNSDTILPICIFSSIIYIGLSCWSGVELFHNSCNELQKSTLWTYALVSFSFHIFMLCICIIIGFSYKLFLSSSNEVDSQRVDNQQVDKLLDLINSLKKVETNDISQVETDEIDISQVEITNNDEKMTV